MRPPQPSGPAAPPVEQVPVVIGLNPCPWEVVDPQRRLAKCKAHGTGLDRKELNKRNGKGKVVRYDCPVYCPDDQANRNERGYCKTGGWINEVFEEDVK